MKNVAYVAIFLSALLNKWLVRLICAQRIFIIFVGSFMQQQGSDVIDTSFSAILLQEVTNNTACFI